MGWFPGVRQGCRLAAEKSRERTVGPDKKDKHSMGVGDPAKSDIVSDRVVAVAM